MCVYAVCSGLPVRKLRVNTVCEQEMSRSANKATESDKDFSFTSIYSTVKSFCKRTAEAWLEPRECLGWTWLTLSAHATKAHFTFLYYCLFLPVVSSLILYMISSLKGSGLLKHICHTSSSLKGIYTLAGGGEVSFKTVVPSFWKRVYTKTKKKKKKKKKKCSPLQLTPFQKGLVKSWKCDISLLVAKC